MVGSEQRVIRIATIGGLAAALVAAPAALAAPPVISGADGDAWNTPPTYVVTGDPTATYFFWRASNGRSDVVVEDPFQVTLRGLAQGPNSLTVVQVTEGQPGRIEQAVRTFVVDTRAPRPVSLSGPATIAAGETLPVAWTGAETGATFSWSVVLPAPPDDEEGLADVVVQGPVDTPTPSAAITGLTAGSYEVLVTQRDQAGNVSRAAALAVTVTPPATSALTPPAAPIAPAAATLAVGGAPAASPPRAAARLPERNTGRLRPRPAATLRIVRPVLRWTRGPAGTTLYNVQLFRVRRATAQAASNAVTLRKVRSVFPRVNRFRTARLARGGCYVWRVWPFRAGSFTRQPLGVSHFCISRRPPGATGRR